jgi:type IV secretion system protein VirB9
MSLSPGVRAWVSRRWPVAVLGLVAALQVGAVRAEALPLQGRLDPRIRMAPYSRDQVYRLYGYVGYEIDLEFSPGEKFLGLGAGDIEGISFVAQGSHLFLKPKAAVVDTNLTILTNLREYEIEYTASARRPSPDEEDVMYAVRFTYPQAPSRSVARRQAALVQHDLKHAAQSRAHNYDYWYCGSPSLKPIVAWDDGVQTHLRFGGKSEQPAVFVRNDDGSESLLNFTMQGGDVVIERVARRIILRRGKLAGCVVNRGFTGSGDRLPTHTISPDIERETVGAAP